MCFLFGIVCVVYYVMWIKIEILSTVDAKEVGLMLLVANQLQSRAQMLGRPWLEVVRVGPSM